MDTLFEINHYLINFNQTIQKADFWGKNRRFFAFWGNFEIHFFFSFFVKFKFGRVLLV
jgi:hypothetical protein